MVRSKFRFGRMFGVFLISLLTMLAMTMTSFASSSSGSGAGMDKLSQEVSSKLAGNQYAASGGGTISGQTLFSQASYTGAAASAGAGADLNEAEFSKLTSAAQTQLVKDIADASYEVMNDPVANQGNAISEDTIQDWWKHLQTKKGAGSKFLSVILENTKPDFVTANEIYKPFSGIVSTILGLIAVVGMALLGVIIVADIFYIVIPPVRMLVADEVSSGVQGGGGRKSSKLFSDDAMYAVKVAEESDDAGGSKKQALGIYLKRRIPMLILLGICLLYLVSGQIYVFVGWILDLVSGFLGF